MRFFGENISMSIKATNNCFCPPVYAFTWGLIKTCHLAQNKCVYIEYLQQYTKYIVTRHDTATEQKIRGKWWCVANNILIAFIYTHKNTCLHASLPPTKFLPVSQSFSQIHNFMDLPLKVGSMFWENNPFWVKGRMRREYWATVAIFI